MKKRIVFLLTLLTALGVIGYFYINTIFLPVHLKQLLIHKAEEFLGREVSIRTIRYSLLRGVVLNDLTIYQKDAVDRPFVHIDHADMAIPLPVIFKTKTLVISSITIQNPYVHIIRRADGHWNFEDLLPQKPADAPAKAAGHAPPLSLGNMTVKEATVELTDEATSPSTNEIYEHTSFRTSFSVREGARFLFETHTGERTKVKFGGVYRIASKELAANFNGENIDVLHYLRLLGRDHAEEFRIFSGVLHWADLRINYRDGQWTVKGDARAQTDLDVYIDEKKNIKGTVTALGLIMNIKGKTVELTTTNMLTIDRGVVTIEDAKTIMGNIQTRNLAMTVTGRDLDLTGTLESKETYIRIRDYLVVEGAAFASGITFNKRGGNLHLTGAVALEKPVITFGQNKNVLTGAMRAENITFHREELSRNIDLQAQVAVTGAELTVPGLWKLKGNLSTELSHLTFLFQENQLDVQSACQLMDADIRWDDGRTLTGSFKIPDGVLTRKEQRTEATASMSTLQTVYTFAGKRFEGAPLILVHLVHDPATAPSLNYSGTMQLSAATLSGLAKIGEAKELKGTVRFANDELSTESLTAVALETPVTVSGKLTGFDAPRVDGKVSAGDVDLKIVERLFPEQVEEYKISSQGRAAGELAYNGPLASPETALYDIQATLRNASVSTALFPEPSSGINGFVRWSNNYLGWKDLGVTFREKNYSLTGELRNFARPILNTKITGEHLALDTTVKILHRAFTVTSLTGTYYDSSFNLAGEVHLTDDNQPDLDVRGHADFELRDVLHLFPAVGKDHPKAAPMGVLSSDFLYKGILKEWRRAVIVASGQSRQLSVYGLAFDNVVFKWGQGDKDYSLLDIKSAFYGGHFTLNSLLDIKTENIPFTLTAEADKADFLKLKNDTPWKKKDFSGVLTAAVALQGPLLQFGEITGQGSVLIQDGQIWKSNLLKGLWSALLIPEYENIIFTDGLMNFEIKDSKILTKDLLLKSKEVELVGNGWADFNSNIDLLITPEFKELAILQSKSFKKGPTAILAQAEGYVNIKITGTLDNPQYKVTTSPTRVIKKATGALVEGLQGIFEEIIKKNW